ncbi:MAG: hypothetical protein V7745_03115 [Pseudomonadales bacterium]
MAESKTYQTAAKPTVADQQQIIPSPLISVNPDSGETRVFITPNSHLTNGLASHNTPVYHARTLYKLSATGISSSVVSLHQQMANRCPRGWIKLHEWVTLKTDTPELHYQFQCLNTSPQD